ncbi:MAG TPA: hypothetical protein EYG02_12330 [Henriciella marina]|uniref:hypothetical protein n=1 Tax=Henriciella sp. TaxID=1968823 RepID=UPI0017D01413|nr:hypothetical protein [Henriciella sp.]HIG22496.1 hypothetical protein [Henriciella sp.]HIK65797.1 hypothetical protein [Henriciella marina]
MKLMKLGAMIACLIIAVAPNGAAQAPPPGTPTMPEPTYRQAALLACPQTVVSEAVKPRLAAGDTAQQQKSYYPQGFISQNAACITRADTRSGTIITTYNEMTSFNQVPLRIEFLENGLAVYSGQKASVLEDITPDMRCYSRTAEDPTMSCTLYVDDEGGFYVVQVFGPSGREISVSVDPAILFDEPVTFANGIAHYEMSYSIEGGMYLNMKDADCEAADWKTLVSQTSLGFGTVEGDTVAIQKTLYFAGDRTPQYNIFYGGGYEMDADVDLIVRTYAEDQAATDIAVHLMGFPATSVIFNRPCGDPLRKDLSNSRVQLMSQVLSHIGGRL